MMKTSNMRISLTPSKHLILSSVEMGAMIPLVYKLKEARTLRERGKLLASLKNFLTSISSLYKVKLPAFNITYIAELHIISTQDTFFHIHYEEINHETTTEVPL